jgi:tetratricopeptide (TPR) repeat protein
MALYDAFISYSHAKDKPIAAALQSAVQKLGKPWYQRRVLRVFRDDTSLSATPQLWRSIEQALGQSRYFLLLVSPEAAASKWVSKEVTHWLDHNSIDTLLIGVTGGELAWDETIGDFAVRENGPLPPVLAGRFPAEPKWVDLRAYRDGADKGGAKFTELAADFAAAIHGMPKEDLLSQEVRQQRRSLTLAWSAAGLLLVLASGATAAGILAYRSQQEAVAQRNRAEQTLATATRSANAMIYDLARGRFRNEIGVPAAFVKDIIDQTLALQQQLTASGQVTPELRYSEVNALDATVEVLLKMGDTAGALKAAQRSRKILEELLVVNPANIAWQADLATVYGRIGQVFVVQGKFDESLDSQRRGLVIRERLLAADRGNKVLQRHLSTSYQGVGDAFLFLGRFAEAYEVYQKYLTMSQQLADADPGNAEILSDVSLAYMKIGETLMYQGKLKEAVDAHRKGLAIAEREANDDQNNARWQRQLLILHGKIGDVFQADNNWEEALKSHQKSLSFAELLADADRSNAESQHDLAVGHYKVGGALFMLGRRDEALKSYDKAVAAYEPIVDGDSENVPWRNDLAEAYNTVCLTNAILGNLETALLACNKSLKLRPDSADTIDSRGFTYLKMRRFDDAIVDYDAALRVQPNKFESLYGRGLARLKKGNIAGGNADIASAKAIRSDVDQIFATFGVR